MDTTPGDELRRRRQAIGFTGSGFAREVGVHRTQVGNVEKNRANPATVGKYVSTLERLERKARTGDDVQAQGPEGIHLNDVDVVEVTIIGSLGGRVSARGSRENVDQILQGSVAHLVSSMIQASQPQST